MSSVYGGDWDEECSVVGEEGGVIFEDFQDDKSFLGFDPLCEGPVVVSVPFAFSNRKPQSALISETASDSITLKNTTEEPVELWSVRIFSSNPNDAFLLSFMRPPQVSSNEEVKQAFVGSTALEDRVLQPGEVLTVWLSCKPAEIGMHTAVIHFVIGDEKIERVAFLLVDDGISQALASNKPFYKGHRRKKFDLNQYVPVSRPRPPSSGKQEFKYYLPKFPIPKDVRKLVENRKVPHVVLDGLNNRNYTDYFSTLLIMEEIHLEEEMRGYDMESVVMRRKGNYLLALQVPGLAERRPSIVYGDFIFAKDASYGLDGSVHPFQGYVYRVEADEVLLKFAEEFHQQHRSESLYNVSFTYNRVNMRRLYQAVQAAAELGPELLFPSEITKRRTRSTTFMVPINKSLNPDQLNCVGKILGCRGAPPYIIYGPPGTGKTMTLVEAISQVCRLDARARVLVCACSNSAADHVLEKLIGDSVIEVEASRMFRLNAPSRSYEDMKADYIPFCFFEDMIFKCPPLKALLRYKIVVSTYMSTSLLYAEHIQRGHFTHIFLDEAGQASEPETMVPIAKLCCRDTVIVLAGDPMQLGPVIFSKDAEYHGLGKSYLQRLFECDHYRDGDENYITKLVRNYRSHPAILELPSLLFYGGELIASKNETDSEIYELINIPNKKFPVLFVGIQGCDEREGSNPSWFNRIEVSKVIEIVKRLKRSTDLSEFDIGVITPYRQQVLKMKNVLESLEMPDVKVGSVEQFQGQERQVIIISTVRSTVKYNELDQIHNLGFLSNHRRFNVAVTRARALLIIVGNPHIVSKDPFWNKLLRYCADNGSYEGCPLPEPETHHSGDETLPSFAGNDLPVEYNNGEVVRNQDLPNQYTNEVEWDEELPKELSKEVDCDELHRVYDNEAEWDEELPDQHIKEAQRKEDLPKHNMDEGDWNEENLERYIEESGWNNESAFSSTNKSEWNEDMPTACTDGGKWRKIILDQHTDEDEGGGGTPVHHTSEAEWNCNHPEQYEDNSKENQDTVEGKAKLDQYNDAVSKKDTISRCHEDARLSEGEVKRQPSKTGGQRRTGWQKASASGGIMYIKKGSSRPEHNPHKSNNPHNSSAATSSRSSKGGLHQWRRSTGGPKPPDESDAVERSFRDVRLG